MKLLEQIVIKIIIIPLWFLGVFILLLQWAWGIVVDIAQSFVDRTAELFRISVEDAKTAYDVLRTYGKYTTPLFNRFRKDDQKSDNHRVKGVT